MSMGKMQHMVVLQFKPGEDGQWQPLYTALERLGKKLGVVHCGGGPYQSSEGANQSFTHGFLMTFANAAARDQYLTHPEHEQIKQQYLPFVANVVAFDFEEPRTV
jgi:hypothetical protein